MYLYVEMWKPRQAWHNLAREQREEFLRQMSSGIDKMMAAGVQLIGLALNDDDVPNDAEFRYVAVWKMPGKGHVHMLERSVRAEGWDNFFEIGNSRGQLISVAEALEDMVCC